MRPDDQKVDKDRLITELKEMEKIGPSDLTEEEHAAGDAPYRWETNFYTLFWALFLQSREELEDNGILLAVLTQAEELGDPWEDFLQSNEALVTELYTLFALERVIIDARQYYTRLNQQKMFNAADQFLADVDSELGIEALAIPIWRKINKLLRMAWEKMEQSGIDPRPFAE